MGKERLCVMQKIAGLNINTNQKLYFSGKISHQDSEQTTWKEILLVLHHSGEQGWPHVPGEQFYMPHHKLLFLDIYISSFLLINTVIQNNTA